LDDATRQRLRRLARHPRLTVVVISGRTRRDLVKRVRVPGLQYLGLHGQERGTRTPLAGPADKLLLHVWRALAGRLGRLPNIWLENKRLSFVIHHRGATAGTVQQARRILQDVLKPLKPALRVLPGKKVWEVLPAGAPGKGAAVADVMKGLPTGTLPIYLGDDTTDESAFAALRKGVTVHVGTLRGSKARYQLRNPAEVKTFLEKLEVEIA
jgi:trehalose-phosphatase